MRDRALGSTIRIYFTTHTFSTGVVVAPSSAFVAADFKIYKDGSATEKTTTNGITVTSPFDSQTGAHLVEIDTSNATGDSGFWASGSAYRVVISTAKTVDSKDPSGVCVGEFSLELQTADVRKAGGSTITQSGGRMEVNTTHLSGTAQTARDIGASVLLSNGTGTGQLKLASGYVAMTWADIASPTTAVNLSGTTIATTQKVDVETIKTRALTAAAGITFGVYVGGAEAAAPASTALSTTTWTNTIAGRIDAEISSRMATYTQPAGFLAATFPSDPADQSVIIAATDAILTAVETRLAAASYTAPSSVGAIADAVWDELRTGHTTAGTFGFYLDAAISGISGGGGGGATAQEVWEYATRTLTGAVELDSSITTKIDSILEDTGTTLPAQISGISGGGGSGTGARTVTITVNDGTNLLQNATVRFTEGVNTFTALTNASGVAVFNLDDANYTVAITKAGYSYAGTTMVVNGTETATYSMTVVSVSAPTNPDLSAIEVLCLNEDFEAVAGVEVDFRMAAIASGDQNRAYPGAKKTITSNGSGIARFEGPQGAAIEWKRGTGQVWTAVTLDNDSVTNVTSLIGSP